ncbi:uncharacterized protein An13g01220 [Aspergillus niger]|uniref:Contig An13c0060, genomic contig n=2 Tax=Aspergillus niger TaxID=5061 RepID=A2R1H2_ASPNC|nr:uncharacterized protein An13g01220 [Aspergillus niger]CAK41522.1 unnamed protein product [Aspergillus niger]
MSESPPPPSWSIAGMANSAVQFLRLPVLASSDVLGEYLSDVPLDADPFCSELIYPRNVPVDARTNVPKPQQFGITDYEDLQIPTPDGESLHALFIRPSRKRIGQNITVLMFHGNAGNIGHRIPIAKVLQDVLGCNVLMLEYRGYGLSTGTPDETGLKVDAQTGLEYIQQRPETRDSKIVVYGQSLGGAVAINLVANNQGNGAIAGLILENTFLSIRKLIPTYVPNHMTDYRPRRCYLRLPKQGSADLVYRVFPPARYLARFCHQYWTSEDILPKITQVPILFLSGLKDEIVP